MPKIRIRIPIINIPLEIQPRLPFFFDGENEPKEKPRCPDTEIKPTHVRQERDTTPWWQR